MTGPHPSTLVTPSIPDGFEVISLAGTPYLRVIADGVCMLSTPTGPDMLEAFGTALLGAFGTALLGAAAKLRDQS